MLNILKMDIYRMFKMRSLYIILGIMAVCVVLTTSLAKMDYDAMEKEYESVEEWMGDEDETINFGMTVTLPTEPGEKTTVFDGMYANIRGKFIALFIVIFAVLFSSADISSGYIKNIAGQVRSRSSLVLSKAFVLFIHTVLTFAVFLLFLALSNQIFFGYVKWGDMGQFALYMSAQILLNYALSLLCMSVTMITRSNVFSMMAAVCVCMNIMVIFYGVVDKLVEKAGIKNFQTITHTITGKMSLLTMEMTKGDWTKASFTAAAFGIAAVLLGCVIFEKRDIG